MFYVVYVVRVVGETTDSVSANVVVGFPTTRTTETTRTTGGSALSY